MTAPGAGSAEGPAYQVSNGLVATAYVPLADIAASVAAPVLAALARARIAAYLGGVPGLEADDATPPDSLRLYVAAAERADARTIVGAVLRAAGTAEEAGGGRASLLAPLPPTEEPDAIDFDATFADLIADWHVDTVAAIREAERALYREDEQWRAKLEPGESDPLWLDEQHYVPPAPPPLPRLAGPTVLATLLVLGALLLFLFGSQLGLDTAFIMLLGVGAVLVAAGLLITRLRERRDDDDDGAVV